MKQILQLSWVLLLLASCQKDLTPESGTEDIVIKVESPIEESLFQHNDTIFIRAEISYTGPLHGYTMQIIDTSTNAILYNYEDHNHSSGFHIDSYWINTLSESKKLKLVIDITINHNGDTKNYTRYFNTQ